MATSVQVRNSVTSSVQSTPRQTGRNWKNGSQIMTTSLTGVCSSNTLLCWRVEGKEHSLAQKGVVKRQRIVDSSVQWILYSHDNQTDLVLHHYAVKQIGKNSKIEFDQLQRKLFHVM